MSERGEIIKELVERASAGVLRDGNERVLFVASGKWPEVAYGVAFDRRIPGAFLALKISKPNRLHLTPIHEMGCCNYTQDPPCSCVVMALLPTLHELGMPLVQ